MILSKCSADEAVKKVKRDFFDKLSVMNHTIILKIGVPLAANSGNRDTCLIISIPPHVEILQFTVLPDAAEWRLEMKKHIAILLAAVMLLSLAACGAAPAAPEAPEAPEAPAVPEAAAPADEAPAEPAPADGAAEQISVSTVDELLAAIGSDRIITLAAGTYDLSTAADYGTKLTADTVADYYWEEVFDGYRLVISNAANLTLKADGEVTLAAIPRYADVIYLFNCENVSLEGMTLGHTEKPGSCAGGVLFIDNCKNTAVTDCALYGCGITAITAANSVGITVSGGKLYDCSINAMSINGSREVRVENCEVYGCGESGYSSLFNISGTTGFVLSDCNVHDNTGMSLVSNSYSFDVYFVGCDFSQGNRFTDVLFDLPGGETHVGGCLFNGTSAWPEIIRPGADTYPLTMDGEMLTSSALFDMAQEHVDVALAASAAPELEKTVNEDGIAEVHVGTVDELLAAIGSNTAIYLDAEVYDLATASNYGGYGGDNYYWSVAYDGPGLVITGVQNLSIISENGAQIITTPRYVEVLSITSSASVKLDGVTLGHTELAEANSCASGVLYLTDVKDAIVHNCHLFGCGTIGLSTYNCDNVMVGNTEMYDCSLYGANVNESSNVTFENCDIHDCGEYAIVIFNSADISYNGASYDDGFYNISASDSEKLEAAS